MSGQRNFSAEGVPMRGMRDPSEEIRSLQTWRRRLILWGLDFSLIVRGNDSRMLRTLEYINTASFTS